MVGHSRVAGEMEEFEDVTAQAEELFGIALAGALKPDLDDPFDAARAWSHDQDAITHVDGFVNIMSDQENGCAARLPKPKHLVLQPHAGERVESA